MGKEKTGINGAQRGQLENGFRKGTSHCLRIRCRAVFLKTDSLSSAKVGEHFSLGWNQHHLSVKSVTPEFNVPPQSF